MHFEYRLDELELAVRAILDDNPNKVLLFHGEMGAGKTTLIKEIARSLGVEGPTSSPTFSLVNEYHLNNGHKLFHFDMYRLKNEAEAYDMGMDEYLYSGEWCLIEWPELIPNLIPEAHTNIHIYVMPDGKRQLTVSHHPTK